MLNGKIARVTGRVADGTTGEVTIESPGGNWTLLAFPFPHTAVFDEGEQVVIVEQTGPASVVVASLL